MFRSSDVNYKDSNTGPRSSRTLPSTVTSTYTKQPSGDAKDSQRSTEFLAHAPQPGALPRAYRSPLEGHPTAHLTPEERQGVNRSKTELEIEEEQYRKLFESSAYFRPDIEFGHDTPRIIADQINKELGIDSDGDDGDSEMDDVRYGRLHPNGPFASPILPSSNYNSSSLGHPTPSSHNVAPSDSLPRHVPGSRYKDALEQEFKIAAAELQRAALNFRRFNDRQGLSASGGASRKQRSHLSKDALGRNSVTNTQRHVQQGAPLRRQRHSPSPVAGPSSVTIECMNEREERQKAATAKKLPACMTSIPLEGFTVPARRVMTRARAKMLAKGKETSL